ncbi:MAG TPA: DUF4383 domain-containing protein [Gaiellaceae bacterium]|jgi:hypothetical protein|nr:DUF4383 domain-containing protein [Gaiellaceae bacterium]
MSGRTRVQDAALLVSALFLVLAVGGFVAGGSSLFGLFEVSVLLNLVHLAFAVAGAVLARTPGSAHAFLLWGGIASLLLWLLGVSSLGGWIPVDYDDNWLHLLLGLGMIGLPALPRRAAV